MIDADYGFIGAESACLTPETVVLQCLPPYLCPLSGFIKIGPVCKPDQAGVEGAVVEGLDAVDHPAMVSFRPGSINYVFYCIGFAFRSYF